MAAKNGRGMKAKGAAYERELADFFNDNVFCGEERCARAPLSGGGSVNMVAGGADLIGPPGLFVEAKRVEKLAWREALAQAEGNATTRKTPDAPIVITRKSREPTHESVVVLRLDRFLPFYEAWLREMGYIKPPTIIP